TIHNLSEPQTPQHRHGEHQRANRPSLEFHLMQLYSHGSTSISTGNCMLPFYCSSNPIQEVRNTSKSQDTVKILHIQGLLGSTKGFKGFGHSVPPIRCHSNPSPHVGDGLL